ncbi:hypothetical protein [uncultured Mycolicibacterium sp.]|uniref:hypothetical protein n=1 Tax=uncultured Mycolicibacterium sp. TaxID=2320817 RepID=UPI0026269598|nr:hypothetical protein [uncultured Mycolicibacterium sp.]
MSKPILTATALVAVWCASIPATAQAADHDDARYRHRSGGSAPTVQMWPPTTVAWPPFLPEPGDPEQPPIIGVP